MSVLIKDMEKPKYCYAVIDGESEYCPFVNTDDDCVILLKKGICEGSWEEQYSKCPLVEEPERLTDDDFETIRIHLNAQKEKLCNQQRWEEAEEYQRIIDRFMAFASAEPETASNGSITCVKSEKMHDRTMGDLISRQDAKDAIDMALDHIDHVPPWVYDKLLNALNEVPSAEKAQLSEEDATKDATSDLISRKELLKQIDIDSDGERGFYGDNWKFIDTIESMPSAEPEVIRCKDCVYYDGRPCGLVSWYNSKDDFCSRAERRGDSK